MHTYTCIGIKNSDRVFIVVAAIFIIIISGIRLIVEIYQFLKSLVRPYQHRLEYFSDLANWLEVPVYSCAIIFATVQLSSTCTCVQDWAWNIGTIGVFLAWTSLVIYMRKLEFLGKFKLSLMHLYINCLWMYRYWHLCANV